MNFSVAVANYLANCLQFDEPLDADFVASINPGPEIVDGKHL